ncbi:MAG: hypothetical protein GXP35_16425, partial [Actinobacteria bacterium]|nr:hypothetical protein [Actinomycetota bacterium]
MTNVYVQQQQNGIDIFRAIVNVAVSKDGSVLTAASRLVANADSADDLQIDASEAAAFAAAAVGVVPTSSFQVLDPAVGNDRAQTLSDGGVSRSAIPARLVYQHVDGEFLRLAWEIAIETLDGQHWWQIRIDAASGEELDRNNLTVHEATSAGIDDRDAHIGSQSDAVPNDDVASSTADWLNQDAPQAASLVADGSSYRVYAQPTEAPSFGARTLVTQPADETASPFGWHDIGGTAGPKYQITRGNNVFAYTDINND